MMTSEHELCVLLCNCPPSEAARLASALVEQSLASCVNIIRGVHSVYKWKGEVCSEEESTLVIKTSMDHVTEIDALMDAQHPHEVYELVQLDVGAVNASYAAWSHAQVGGS